MTVKKTPLAITGMACRLPGAKNVEQYWDLLINGRCAISRIPDEKLDRTLYYSPEKGALCKTCLDKAGLVEYGSFNASKYPFPADYVKWLEPQHWAICTTAAEACRNAGLDPFALSGSRIGVYLGNKVDSAQSVDLNYSVMIEETARYLLDLPRFRELTGEQAESIVNEIVSETRAALPKLGDNFCPTISSQLMATAVTRALKLDGPSLAFDAACSSSIHALAVAMRDLALGNVDAAIVGGVAFYRLLNLAVFSAARALTTSNSRPFGDLADGFVYSEGYGAIVVKTLDRALADGDPIQAVVRGVGISSDGKCKSHWAPSSDGQYKAIMRAYDDPEDMSRLAYLEAHATSTSVGDLTEIQSVTRAFADKFQDGKKRPMGAVKANIGHTIASAGVAGLIKAVLVLQKNLVPPQINCESLNTKVDWNALPFYVPRQVTFLPPSNDGKPRMAGVNSFGVGGLNAYAVVEDAPVASTKTSVAFCEIPKESGETNVGVDSSQARPEDVFEPIAVVGVSGIIPGVRTAKEFENLIFSDQNVFSDVPKERWNAEIFVDTRRSSSYRAPFGRGGFVRDYQPNWRRFKIPPKQVANADPLQFMILDALDAALTEAGYDRKPFDRERVGVVVASSFASDFESELNAGIRTPLFQKTLKEALLRRGFCDAQLLDELCDEYFREFCKRKPAILDETGGYAASSLASRVTKAFDLSGGATALEAGGVGAVAAFATAMNALRASDVDLAFVAAGSRATGVPTFVKMGLSDRLADGKVVRPPFDVDGGKTVPGEGVGVFVLKRLSDALRDGDSIQFVLRGSGFSSVSPRASRAEISGAFERAVDRAWAQTSFRPSDVAALELAVADSETSVAELDACAKRFPASATRRVALGSIMPQFGDMSSASGAVATLKAALELAKGRAPKVVGCSSFKASAFDALKNFANPLQETPLESAPNGSFLACVNSWDTCGSVGCLVVEQRNDGRYEIAPKFEDKRAETPNVSEEEKKLSDPWRLVRFGASTKRELARALREGRDLRRPFAPSEKERAVVVVPNDGSEREEEFRERLENAAKQLETREKVAEITQALDRLNVVYAQKSEKLGKISFMFSGQGSQYPSMLQDLIQKFEPARVAAKELNETLRKLGEPTFEELTVSGAKALGVDVYRTQLSLLCADWIAFRTLLSFGIRPDVVAGHSFGEFPALVASGAWTLAQGIKATRIRCEAIVECDEVKGTMSSTNADGATVKRICALFPGKAFAANFNAPTQTVVGAYKEVLPELEKKLQEEKFLAKTIPVPRPFHTPLMAPVRPLLEKRLVAVRPRVPQTPFVSSVTNKPTSEPDEILQNLAKQMTASIDYIGLTRFLVEKNDVELLVESGPKRVLTGLHQKIIRAELAEDSNSKFASTRCFAPDAPGRESGQGFYQLRALCEALGYFDTESANVLKEQETTKDAVLQSSLYREEPLCPEENHETKTDRASRLERSEGVVGSNVLKSANVESKRQVLALASILKVKADELTAWLLDLCDGDLSRRDLAAVALDATDAWNAPLQKVADAVERFLARSRSRDSVKNEEAYMSPVDCYDAMRQGEPVETFPNQTYRRFRIYLVPREFSELDRNALKLSGSALIYGRNAFSLAFADRLTELGCKTTILPFSGEPKNDARRAAEICEQAPTQTLFLFASHDESLLNARDDARDARRAVALGSFLVTQSWLTPITSRGELSSARLLAATASGGGFCLDAPSDAVEVGALAGLTKSLFYEIGSQTGFAFRAQIVDFSKTDSPEYKRDRVLDVITADVPFEIETGFIEGRRVLVRPLPARAKEAGVSQKTRPSGLWVVTGGGRGVTAFLAREIAKRYGLKLAIVGSSPTPNVSEELIALDEAGLKLLRNKTMREASLVGASSRTAWNGLKREIVLAKSLKTFELEGVDANYYSCDVTDAKALDETIQQIRRDNPTTPISGVFHGAGIEVSAAFLKKKCETVERTFDIKTEGVRNLIESTQNDPLRWFVAMGSLAGRMGGIGQSDYSAANDCMAKILDNFHAKRPECRVSLFHWGPWDELGMAVRPETASSIVMKTFPYLPPKEGLNYVVEELESDPSEPVEKLFAPYEVVQDFYGLPTHTPTENERREARRLSATTKNNKYEVVVADDATEETSSNAKSQESRPIVEKLLVCDDDAGYIEASATLRPDSDPFLTDGRLYNRPFLPAGVSMEAFCEVLACAYPDRKVATIANLTFKNALVFPTDQPRKIKIKAQRLEMFDDLWNMSLCADHYDSRGILVARDRVYSQCVVKTVDRAFSLGDAVDEVLSASNFAWVKVPKEQVKSQKFERASQDAPIRREGCLRRLQTFALYDSPYGRVALGEARAFSSEEFAQGREGVWLVPAATVEACLALCDVYLFPSSDKETTLPLSFASVTFACSPRQGERCRIVCRELDKESDVLRVVLFGEDDRALLILDGYRAFVLKNAQ